MYSLSNGSPSLKFFLDKEVIFDTPFCTILTLYVASFPPYLTVTVFSPTVLKSYVKLLFESCAKLIVSSLPSVFVALKLPFVLSKAAPTI